ncbi:MAG: IS30 family transposase, partial [Clostridium sp.]
MERTFKHLTKADRIRIEALIKAGVKIKEIADMLHVHRSTIYRELKRGRFTALNSDLTTEERYSPDIAHDKYEENLKSKGGSLKIGNDIKLANYIEEKIVKEDYSPAAVLGEIKAQQKESEFSVMICTTTLYSYIDKGIFLHLTNKNLPVKKNKKRTYKKVKKTQARASAGESIEKRPEEIETREEFGHWEMDTVK